jgi:hypothetical protein
MLHVRETFIVIPGAVAMHSQLNLADKMVYGAMLAVSSKTGFCFASHDRIAARCGVSRITVLRCIRTLQSHRCLSDYTDDPIAQAEIADTGAVINAKCRIYKCLIRTRKSKPKLVSMPRETRKAV